MHPLRKQCRFSQLATVESKLEVADQISSKAAGYSLNMLLANADELYGSNTQRVFF